ncbi:MAG: YceI family protein [Lewinellaceae bacterium]|nr:YceI family protein [Lewinellaceae bacterium]
MKLLLLIGFAPFFGNPDLGPNGYLVPMERPVAEYREAGLFSCNNGRVAFKSEAPLEVIEAESKHLRGILDAEKQTFAWTVEIQTFEGFNNALQREHFNENYLESRRFPKASFTGKIIESMDFSKEGTYSVRAKGKLNIHGKEQERIIKSQVVVVGNRVQIRTDFRILLADHDIRIPKIVYQKIAEEVQVVVQADLLRN